MPLSEQERSKRDAQLLLAGQASLTDRLLAELDFASEFIKLHPDKATEWAKKIAKGRRIFADSAASADQAAVAGAVQQVERLLAPIGKLAKSYTIHFVGHAHIDMNWMWSWPETVGVTNDTFATMLALMEEFPDFTFSQSQASVYEIARQHHPELFEQIRRRVQEGRWEVCAVHWVEGDKNIAGGESLARHMLYTRQYMAEHFGLRPQDVQVDWEPDTFGHAWTIPTIVTRGGARHYYMCRGGNFEKPRVFWFAGPDGSRVLVFLDTTWYNDHIAPHCATNLVKFCQATGLKDWMCVYGVGDHGGGPTRRDILRCHDMDAWPIYPRFRLGKVSDYYKLLEANGEKWPVLQQELNFEFTGCYTTQTQIKRNNRLGENYMLEAETAAALAWRALGRPYPAQAIRDSWTDVLFSHFHDILPGSGVAETRQYNQGTFQRVAAAASMIKTQSLRALASAIDTSFAGPVQLPAVPSEQASIAIGGGAGRGTHWGGLSNAAHVIDGPRPVVVFNPTAHPRTELVGATVWDADTGSSGGDLNAKSFAVRAGDGQLVPAQKIGTGNYWGHKFVDVVFPAKAGGLGYAAYSMEEGTVAGHEAAVKTTDSPPRHISFGPSHPVMENEHLLVEFDVASGGVTRLIDKASGKDLADPARPLGILEYTLERPGGMTAWVIQDMKEVVCPLPLTSLRTTATGPHLAMAEAQLKIKDSTATVAYSLKAGQPWLEIEIKSRWVERGGPEAGIPGLRMRFPLALEQAKARYEIPFGSIQRDLAGGQEVPALRWADVTGKPTGGAGKGQAGCAVLNDSKYGHSLDGSTLRVTLIRSTYDPDPLPEIGDHVVRLAVVPHGKSLSPAELTRLGAGFNHPLQVVATSVHQGQLPSSAAAVGAVSPAGVVVSSVRKAQDDGALIFHLYETAGAASTAKVALDGKLLGKVAQAVEVDLLERPVEHNSAKPTAEGFSVSVPAYGIAAVKVVMG